MQRCPICDPHPDAEPVLCLVCQENRKPKTEEKR